MQVDGADAGVWRAALSLTGPVEESGGSCDGLEPLYTIIRSIKSFFTPRRSDPGDPGDPFNLEAVSFSQQPFLCIKATVVSEEQERVPSVGGGHGCQEELPSS